MNNLASHELTADQIDALVDRAGGHDQVLRILAGELDLAVIAPPTAGHSLTVPTGFDFEERFARGRYGWRNPDLTEQRFPVTAGQIGELELKRFHFNRGLSSETAIRLIREDGYQPAEIGHLLAFGERFPEEQRRYPVIGLGSVVEVGGSLSVPALWFDGDRRTLDLIWYDGDWHRNYRFIGVRPRRFA